MSFFQVAGLGSGPMPRVFGLIIALAYLLSLSVIAHGTSTGSEL